MKMNRDHTIKGMLYALAAAALNGTIGALSKILIALDLPPAWIALLKTALGLVVVSAVLLFLKTGTQPRRQRNAIALAAFLGMFTLFFFETHAYKEMGAANVVIVLMAMGAVTANMAGWFLLNDKPGSYQWLGLLMTVSGISAILGINGDVSLRGVLLAACAGTGYGLFTVILKKFRIKGGLGLTRQLLLWGTVFLAMPAMTETFDTGMLLSAKVFLALLGLAVLPSILGFFCTTRAVDYLPPAKVQLLELSEPLFAATIAFLVLGEEVTVGTVVGALFTVIGIYVGAVKADEISVASDAKGRNIPAAPAKVSKE